MNLLTTSPHHDPTPHTAWCHISKICGIARAELLCDVSQYFKTMPEQSCSARAARYGALRLHSLLVMVKLQEAGLRLALFQSRAVGGIRAVEAEVEEETEGPRRC
jgi:hypothetical protein